MVLCQHVPYARANMCLQFRFLAESTCVACSSQAVEEINALKEAIFSEQARVRGCIDQVPTGWWKLLLV
jgi:hypothetical protein